MSIKKRAVGKRQHAGGKARKPVHVLKQSKKRFKAKSAPKASAKKAEVQKKPVVKINPAERERQNIISSRKSREAVANTYTPEEVTKAVEQLSANEAAVGYLKKNVSKRAIDVINTLVSPKTDEALAIELDMKINAVRRILNIMQGYGITNYYIAKNVNGWLSFAWYVNVSKLPPFFDYINSIENKKPMVTSECNDYFVCGGCYDATKMIFTFDAAFEESFKCGNCGKNMNMMDKDQASKLINSSKA